VAALVGWGIARRGPQVEAAGFQGAGFAGALASYSRDHFSTSQWVNQSLRRPSRSTRSQGSPVLDRS
jgi:hypothetical protein